MFFFKILERVAFKYLFNSGVASSATAELSRTVATKKALKVFMVKLPVQYWFGNLSWQVYISDLFEELIASHLFLHTFLGHIFPHIFMVTSRNCAFREIYKITNQGQITIFYLWPYQVGGDSCYHILTYGIGPSGKTTLQEYDL